MRLAGVERLGWMRQLNRVGERLRRFVEELRFWGGRTRGRIGGFLDGQMSRARTRGVRGEEYLPRLGWSGGRQKNERSVKRL